MGCVSTCGRKGRKLLNDRSPGRILYHSLALEARQLRPTYSNYIPAVTLDDWDCAGTLTFMSEVSRNLPTSTSSSRLRPASSSCRLNSHWPSFFWKMRSPSCAGCVWGGSTSEREPQMASNYFCNEGTEGSSTPH